MDNEKKKNLLQIICSKEHLLKAWKFLNKNNKKSHGLSRETIEDFELNIEANLTLISSELADGTFQFRPNRAAIIKKGGGKFRPLQIPEIRDRVVLKSIALILEEELSDILAESEGYSFAYQKGLGVKDAVKKMVENYKKEKPIILKADIINFFEEVEKNNLLAKFVFPNLRDDSINSLTSEGLSQPLKGLNRLKKKHRNLFKNAGTGIPQGNPISPLLSNIYLSEFDKEMKNNHLHLVRYADDFIISCDSEEYAEKAYKISKDFLRENYNLKIHELDSTSVDGKTRIVNPTESIFSFLSIRFDGENIFPKGKKIGILKSKIKKEILSSNQIQHAVENSEKVIRRWISIYSYSDVDRYFNKIDSYIVYQLRKRFGKKRHYMFTKTSDITNEIRIRQGN